MEGGWSTPRPGRFIPGKDPVPIVLGGAQSRYGMVGKISHTPGLYPRTVQPVASRYTDWAIAADQTCHSSTTWTGLESNRASAAKGPRLNDIAQNGTVSQLSLRSF